jgi:excisionase family DNA binding protein
MEAVAMTLDILTTPEAAAYTRMSKPTLERWRLTGDGPIYVKLGKAVRYRRADLDAWLASKLIHSTSEGA